MIFAHDGWGVSDAGKVWNMSYDECDDDFRSYTYIADTKYNCNPTVDKEKHPFDDLTLLEPFLNQDKYWCDKNKVYIKIENMEAAHALNAARLLLRRYKELIFTINLSREVSLDESEENIKSYPLFAALIKQAKGEAEKKYPWEKLKK